jgi:hypothetical protein
MPVINGVYLKDFTALPGAVADANIIPIAISGNQIAYRTTVSGIVTDARVTSKLLTGLSVTGGAISATDTILQAFGKVQNQINGSVLSLSAIGATPNANAATITGTVLNLQPASSSFGGVVTTGTQTFAGDKTLTGALVGTTGSFASSGGSDTFGINHSSGAGIALNITKGGNGEGIYVNKTSGSGNAATIIGTLNATTLVKSGGTSSQFLKADGTVDGTAYTALNGTGIVEMAGTTPSYLSSTGTGDVVKATSPTLVTPALGTPASGVMTNVTGTAAGLTAGLIVDQANSATIDAAATNVINSIALRDADGDIFARTFNMANNYGDFVPNKLVGTSSSGQIREMSQAIAKTYLDLSGTNTGDQTTITGNAGTATALETTRTIWGQNFNGSANVSGALTGVTGITTSGGYTQSGATANTFTGASTFTKNVTVKSGNGDQLVLDNAGERFTQTDYYNDGGQKAVTYWDNTNNFFQIITTPASSTIRAVAGTNGVELANGGTSWTALSDIREKKIIRPIEDALTTMKDFRTVIGRYKTDSINVERAFLIAQDVQKTYPYAVTVAQDENKTLRLAYTELIPLMIKAIQELEAKIKILEDK